MNNENIFAEFVISMDEIQLLNGKERTVAYENTMSEFVDKLRDVITKIIQSLREFFANVYFAIQRVVDRNGDKLRTFIAENPDFKKEKIRGYDIKKVNTICDKRMQIINKVADTIRKGKPVKASDLESEKSKCSSLKTKVAATITILTVTAIIAAGIFSRDFTKKVKSDEANVCKRISESDNIPDSYIDIENVSPIEVLQTEANIAKENTEMVIQAEQENLKALYEKMYEYKKYHHAFAVGANKSVVAMDELKESISTPAKIRSNRLKKYPNMTDDEYVEMIKRKIDDKHDYYTITNANKAISAKDIRDIRNEIDKINGTTR